MPQTLVIQESFYKALGKEKNLEILNSLGVSSAHEFFTKIIEKLNEEFAFLEIGTYRFALTPEDKKGLYQYSGFVEGDNLHYEKIIIFFTPIDSKLGDVIIEQSLMPTICSQMEENITFLLDEKYKKIALLTSKINANNKVDIDYNKMQMDVNSLNTLNIDVIPFFSITNLSTDTKFNTLTEYMEMSDFLQKKSQANSQIKYLSLENSILYGNCDIHQLEGQFIKSFCFRYLTAMFSGGNDFKYDISRITSRLRRLDNQFDNLNRFIEFANDNLIKQGVITGPIDNDIIESDDDLEDINDIHRKPERGIDSTGRKRFKTNKKIRDSVLAKANYLCDCNDSKHFYFESVELDNYVEGHHIVPMNRQQEYYFDSSINLDIPNNIIPLCPNCHSQIHLGSRQARLKIISELYVRNKAKLLSINPNLTLSILASYYNIGLENEEEKYWIKKAEKTIEEKINSLK